MSNWLIVAFTELSNTGIRIGIGGRRGVKKIMRSGLESLCIRALLIEWIGRKPYWGG